MRITPLEIQDKGHILWPIVQRANVLQKQTFLSMQLYTTDDLNTLAHELDPAWIATHEVGDMLVFFGC